jgi:hypothetical protein
VDGCLDYSVQKWLYTDGCLDHFANKALHGWILGARSPTHNLIQVAPCIYINCYFFTYKTINTYMKKIMVNSRHILGLVFICLDVITHNCPKLCSPSAKVHTLLLILQKALEEVVYNILLFNNFQGNREEKY